MALNGGEVQEADSLFLVQQEERIAAGLANTLTISTFPAREAQCRHETPSAAATRRSVSPSACDST